MMRVAQCFPRWRYPKPDRRTRKSRRMESTNQSALTTFQTQHYAPSVNTILTRQSPKTLFLTTFTAFYTRPSYRDQFANDLSKMLPHIPYAPDFRAFAEAGETLADLHLNYETCERYPDLKLNLENADLFWEEKPEHFLLDKRGMYFKDKNTKDTLIINEHVLLSGIPEEAHRYVVNGRTPLEWFINRYKITLPEKNNGILNDPNGWFENPRDLITAIERIVYVSVESTKIIENLPSQITSD